MTRPQAATEPRFPRPSRAVVKVGSSSLRGDGGRGIDRALVSDLARQIAAVRAAGTEVVLVTSGAVAAGMTGLGMAQRPSDTPSLQAAASVGQGVLMHTYSEAFASYDVVCGQVLLTPDDVVHRERYLNARHTFTRLLELGALPIVNENDTVATDELRFGDNDRLAALVASMLGAQLLVLLSDVEGLLDGDPAIDPAAPLLDRVDDLAALDARHFGGTGSELGSGGMASKLEAARVARFSAAHTVIANARRDGVVTDAVAGAGVGTWFVPARRRPDSRKLWIAFAKRAAGHLVVDSGAVRALTAGKKSLLAAGVVDAAGDFAAGDAVQVRSPDGVVIARGLVGYSREEVLRIRGRSSEELARELGEAYTREVIHRDALVMLSEGLPAPADQG
ncbi:MAG TPA: glutamate 5-kinase [Egibacteraceae bacterium]|nr:glutamate 5-kinase [Egibacteraceae bacterium]